MRQVIQFQLVFWLNSVKARGMMSLLNRCNMYRTINVLQYIYTLLMLLHSVHRRSLLSLEPTISPNHCTSNSLIEVRIYVRPEMHQDCIRDALMALIGCIHLTVWQYVRYMDKSRPHACLSIVGLFLNIY